MVQSYSSKLDEESQPVTKWERDNQETTRELLKVKDRLIEVERNVSISFALLETVKHFMVFVNLTQVICLYRLHVRIF